MYLDSIYEIHFKNADQLTVYMNHFIGLSVGKPMLRYPREVQ